MIPPLFDFMRNAMMALIDDFRLHTKTESQLLEHLEELSTSAANIICTFQPENPCFAPRKSNRAAES